jgi:hypothetical protein
MYKYKMTTSILEQEYVEPDRPYSQRELQYNRNIVFNTLRIGKTRAHHKRCDHFYYVKDHGRKEKEIKEVNSEDVGNCSVCWKFNKTPKHMKTTAKNLTNEYCKKFYDPPKYLTYEDVDLETTFVKWLYE